MPDAEQVAVTPRLLTYRDAAEQLRCSVAAVRRLVREGALPCVEVNARVRCIRQQDVDRFVAERLRLAGVRRERPRHAVILARGERLWD